MPNRLYASLCASHLAVVACIGTVVVVTASCASNPSYEDEDSADNKVEQPIHAHLGCAIKNLGLDSLAAAVSRYGNWCGPNLWGNPGERLGDENGLVPLPPMNCWDAACRIHDYALGRPTDGSVSCHSIFDKAGFPAEVATSGVDAADRALCDQWAACSKQAVATQKTWTYRTMPGQKPGVTERVCVSNPKRKPARCDWLSQPATAAYTCDPLLCPSVPPLAPAVPTPAPGCGVDKKLSPEDALAKCCTFSLVGARPDACGSCTPKSCRATGATCGVIPDGCGGTLDCGACATPNTCGGGGVPNQCGCKPTTCAAESCGSIPDGCGGTVDCGACAGPNSCGGAGVPNQCGCRPASCAADSCGSIPDGCGGSLDCGACVAPNTCGGAGVPNQCGCKPATCAADSCGSIPDGCGGSLDCGACVAPNTCGGAGVPNQCGCKPATCASLRAECGSVANGCGGTLNCGSCTAPSACDTSHHCSASSFDVSLSGEGSAGGGIAVDDDLSVYLNGALVFVDANSHADLLAPPVFSVRNGDVLRIVAVDTVGVCRSLSPDLALHRLSDGAQQFIGGFDAVCGTSAGEVFFDKSLVIAMP
jgi:hypothetical protein